MKDISSGIINLLNVYGTGPEQLRLILESSNRPEYLYALSELRQNLLEWYPFSGREKVLQIGSDYGILTGLLAVRADRVTVLEENEENLQVNRRINGGYSNICWQKPQPGERFDLILLAGPEAEMKEETLARYFEQWLAPEGTVLFACTNALGLKALEGDADPDEARFTRGQLERLFQQFSHVSFYYPMPDYKLASAIYSENYLPGLGELGAGAAYEKTRYSCINQEAFYGQLLREGDFGRFADSFLVIAGSDPRWKETQYVKYNRTRRPQFQIRTRITEQDGVRRVEKAALQEEGIAHVRSFETKYEQLKNLNPAIVPLKPEIAPDGRRASFEFLQGETLLEQLAGQIEGGCLNREAMDRAMELVFDLDGEKQQPFRTTEAFTQVFGEIPELEDISYVLSNVDGIFENIMVSEGEYRWLDYEWVFDFPVPAGFLRYRNLAYVYYRCEKALKAPSLEEFLADYGISGELAEVYGRMEASFQRWVHGDENQGYLANYRQRIVTLEELKEEDAQMARVQDRLNQLNAELDQKNLQLKKTQEVQRLTNNHVANLEVLIKNLRHEVEEQGKLAAYLNRHEALIFKLRRKAGNRFNRAFPKGTRKRKILKYSFNTIKHPIRYGKLYTSDKGKNLIQGDFEIGEDYVKYGKLRFPEVPPQGPMVSIVIPCYNQIHYTYACLQSILEHTKDVTYEVIIADDVSTDATARLEQYTEGLVISRNQTNQGFLLNCNQAAARARGKYIFFLNNDTKVTPGWLSSLVELIESDPTIGMVGSKLIYPDGRLQEAGGIIWSDGSGWNYGRLDDPDKSAYNYVKDVDYISGAAIMLSRDLWKQIGGFDQRFAPAYYEDADLAFEVRRAGYRVVYQPLSKVIHFEGVSNGTDLNGPGLKRYQVKNCEKFKEKWKDELKNQGVNNGNPNPFRARERSWGKRIIFAVDHYVPTYDKDAGSKVLFQYLKLFLQKGFVVKFMGDNFLHEEPYTTALEQLGIEVLYGDEYASGIWDWLEKNGKEISFAYLNRPHVTIKYVDFIREHTSMKIIYAGMDFHYLRLSRAYELSGDTAIKKEADYWKSIEMTVMHKSDISYFPSYVEVGVIHSIDDEVRAKAVPLYVYDSFRERIQEDFEKREGLLFVGGFAHPPNADGVLWFCREVFPLIRRQLPQVQFYVVGSKVPDEIRALEKPDSGVVVKGFVPDEELEQLYQTCKISVVPLRYGAGVKGKVVDAIYNGIPTVTTSIGAEGIPNVETALKIEDEPEAFARQVVALYQDSQACRQLSAATQTYIRENFSLESAWRAIEEDFKE